jgi:hypothetical protein
VIDVDIIGAEAAQAGLTGFKDVLTRRADVIWPCTQTKRSLGGDENIVALAFDGFAENLFREAVGIHIRSIEKIDTGVEADTYHALGFRDIDFSPCAKKGVPSAKSAGAEAKHWNFQSGMSE